MKLELYFDNEIDNIKVTHYYRINQTFEILSLLFLLFFSSNGEVDVTLCVTLLVFSFEN